MRNTISHGSEKKVGDPPTCNAERDIVYRPIDAEREQDPKLAQLDLYFTDLGGGKRVVVYVHGGSWTRGDKSEIHENPRLLEFLLRNECLVASVNFRPIQTNEARKVTYADQANDIAAALKWLSKHVEEFGGRPEGFILLGYSSGAHLSALVALDDRYLSNQGLDGSWVEGVISMDVHSYDIPAALIEMEQSPLKKNISRMTSLFGGSRSEQDAASPIAYLANLAPKSFLLFSCGRSGGLPQTVSKVMSKSFKESLIAHGHRAVHVHLGHCDHRSILSRFGSVRDRVSKNIKDFLEIATPSRGPAIRTRSKLLASSLASNIEISEERQREAVRLAETTNRPAVEIAREFGVPLHEFYSWRKQFNRHRSTSDSPASGKGSVRRGRGNIAPPVQNSIEEISEERQREAVRLAETTNRPAVEIAREFGVSLREFYSWRKHFKQHRSTSDSRASGKGSVSRGPGNIAPRVQNSIEGISEERQREAVRLAETTNRPAVEIAREFGVSLHEFYVWRKQFNRHRSTSDSRASGKGSVRRGPGNIAPRVRNSIEGISEERQREAVRLAETTNRPAVEIAREFGVSLREFYSWRKHFKQHRSTRMSASTRAERRKSGLGPIPRRRQR